MSPYPIVAPPHEEELAERIEQEIATGPPPSPARGKPAPEGRVTLRPKELFAETLLEMSGTRPARRTLDFFFSFIVHFLILTLLVLVPLVYTDTLDFSQFSRTMLVAPPPPPPPPPPAAPTIVKRVTLPKRVFTLAGKLVAPTVIPERVAMLREEELPPDVGAGVMGGVPGGVAGGQLGGVIGGILSGAQRPAYIPPAPPRQAAPIRVGGRVKAPRAILSPQPVYPALARQAKVSGDVVLDAVIDPTGNVVEIQVVSGHPLLLEAALNAVRNWKYEPTYLNDEPVAVKLIVTVRFRLD